MSNLDPGTVAIWHGQFADTEGLNPGYLPLLSADELARAANLSNPLMQRRHIEMRGRLRRLLADYLHQPPASIRIARTNQGKPYLPDNPQWVFNLSHTAGDFAIAIAHACQLGIDIECYHPRASLAGLIRKCFADEEALHWQDLPEQQKIPAFYQFWTKKEAFVKATGRGIALGLKHCVVDPQHPEKFLRIPPNYGATEDWRIISLELATPSPNGPLCLAVVVDICAEHHCFRLE